MKKSVSKGGALPKFRFTLAVFALAASCGARPRSPVEVEIKAQPITIPNLNARALTIDTNGYVGDICIGTFGCYLDGTIARPFELPAGVHDIFSNYCHHPTNGQDHRLGTITVDAAGRGTVDTNHFDPVNETTIRARTIPIPINLNGHPLSLGFDGSGNPVKTTSPRLLLDRGYGITEYQSIDGTTGNHSFVGKLIIANAVVSLAPGTDPVLRWDGSTLHVQTQPVTVDYRGYAGIIGFGRTSRPGPVATFHFIPNRRYHMFDAFSRDTATHTIPLGSGSRAVVAPDGRLTLGDGLQRQFAHSPTERRIHPILATMELATTAPACLQLSPPACPPTGGPPITIPVLNDREYRIAGTTQWIKVDAAGSCTPSTVDVTGGRVTVRCRDGAPPPASAARVVLRGACRLVQDGQSRALFAVETTGSEDVRLPVGAANAFNGAADVGQPTWFNPGTSAFVVDFDGLSERSWRLGGSELTVRPGDSECPPLTVLPDGVREGVVIDGKTFGMGLSGERALLQGLGVTHQAPGIRPGVRGPAAGNSNGSFAVSHDGAATYQIPIHTPPGRAGLAPRPLALTYNSQSGNGIAGVGWALAGVSRINRCALGPATGAADLAPFEWREPDKAEDPTYGLCLDGKRLLPLWSSESKTPTGYRLVDDPLTTIVPKDSDGLGPLAFEVEDGLGNRFTYGSSNNNTRLEGVALVRDHFRCNGGAACPQNYSCIRQDYCAPPPNTPPERRLVRYAWSLYRATDRFGQHVEYAYTLDKHGTEPQAIEQNLDTVSWGNFRAKFSYDPTPRPDPIERFVRGLRLLQTKRLAAVEVSDVRRNRLITRTALAYQPPAPVTGRSRLESYRECDGRGACKHPVSFKWQDPDMTYSPVAGFNIPLGATELDNPGPMTVLPVDLNRDGRDDIIFSRAENIDNDPMTPERRIWFYVLSPFGEAPKPLGLASGTEDVFHATDPQRRIGIIYHPPVPADVDGDGTPELGVWDAVLDGYKFSRLSLGGPTPAFTGVAELSQVRSLLPMVGDFNGDGRVDFVSRVRSSREGTTRIHLGTNPAVDFVGLGETLKGIALESRVVNLTAEGRDGLVIWDQFTGTIEQVNVRRKLVERQSRKAYDFNNQLPSWLLDANGDGLVDVITSTSTSARFQLNPGHGGVTASVLIENDEGNALSLPEPTNRDNGFRVADVDGDGRQDLLVLGESIDDAKEPGLVREPVYLSLGYGGKFEVKPLKGVARPRATGLAQSCPSGTTCTASDAGYRLTRVMDIDGDGVPEILQTYSLPNSAGAPRWGLFRRQSMQADLLSEIENSLGGNTLIQYLPMSDPAVHTPGKAGDASCSYPYYCHVAGRWLVRSVGRETGRELAAGAEVAYEHHSYWRGRSDRSGSGWLGFEAHTVDESFRGRVTSTSFDNTTFLTIGSTAKSTQHHYFPLVGLPRIQRVTFQPPASQPRGPSEVRETEWEYRNIAESGDDLANARVFIRPDSTCERRMTMAVGSSTGEAYAETCTKYEKYDALGFLEKSTHDAAGESRVTETRYRHDFSHSPRLVGVVTNRTETSTLGGQTKVRAITIAPDPSKHYLPLTVTEARAVDEVRDLTTTFVRDDLGAPTKVIVAGEISAVDPVSRVRPSGVELQERVSETKYDDYGYKYWSRDAEGHVERVAYDPAWGLVTAHIDRKGVLTTSKYDGFGRMMEALSRHPVTNEALNGGTSVLYETPTTLADGPLRPGTYPLTVTTERTSGAIVLERRTVAYNRVGKAIYEEAAAPRGLVSRTWTKHDIAGRVLAVSPPQYAPEEPPFRPEENETKGYAVTKYDALDRLVERDEPDGVKSASIGYNGLSATVVNARMRSQRVEQDAAGRLIKSETLDTHGRAKGSVTFTYAPFGTVRTATTRLNEGPEVVTTMGYDNWGNRTSIEDPDRGTRTYAFNSFGEEIYEVLPVVQGESGRSERRRYDKIGRLTSRSNPDGESTFWHGPAGVTLAISPTGVSLGRQYDEAGRVQIESLEIPQLVASSASDPSRRRLQLETIYEPGTGRVTGLRYPAHGSTGTRFEVTYKYSQSAGSVLMSVEQVGGGTLWRAESYDPRGQVAQECFGNLLRVAREIDAHTGLLTRLRGDFVKNEQSCGEEAGPARTLPLRGTDDYLQDLRFGYDDARNLESRIDAARAPGAASRSRVSESYGYDDLNRLETWAINSPVSRVYTVRYDDFGNLKERGAPGGHNTWAFTHTKPDRPHAVMTATIAGIQRTFDYDERGRRKVDTGRRIAYRWFDLPKTITASSTPAQTFEFDYDAFHSRVGKSGGGWDAFTFGDLYERRSPAGSPNSARHIYRVMGPGRIVAEVERTGDGEQVDKRYLHPDHLGSPDVVTTDGPDVNAFSKQRFEPFGNSVKWQDPSTNADEVLAGGTLRGFTGHEHDPELGFVNMKGRIYDPGTASFLTTDPVVAKPMWAHAFHPYSYVVNNPMNAVDPTGFQPEFTSGDPNMSQMPDDPASEHFDQPQLWVDDAEDDPICRPDTTDPKATRSRVERQTRAAAPPATKSPTPSSLGDSADGEVGAPRNGKAQVGRPGLDGTPNGSVRPSGLFNFLFDNKKKVPAVVAAGVTVVDLAVTRNPKTLLKEGADELATRVAKTATDRLTQHTTVRDLVGAAREVKTGVQHGGQHLKEVSEAAQGLRIRIEQIKNGLSKPTLSPANRAALMEELSKASRNLDTAEDALRGAYRRHDK